MTQDEAICVFRHFKWDAEKMQEAWFDNEDKLKLQLGIEFDRKAFLSLPKDKQQVMSASLKENNGGCCLVCYGSFADAQ